jgi:hypothetical protein
MHRLVNVESHEPPAIEKPGAKSDIVPIVVAIAVFTLLSLWGAITSSGFLEADSCMHYLYARYALAEPFYFVNVWGRPVCTGLYAVPAYLAGRLGVRITSLLVALGIALIARQIAKGQKWQWPVLALIFTLAQPLVFLHSFSELTELPFALLLALGFWAYQRKNFWAMALAIGLTPLSRPEGFGFLILAAIALVMHRRWWWLVILSLPLLLWDYTGWRLYGQPGPWWHWLAANWPYARQSLYNKGPLLHFMMLMPVVASPFIFPATVAGVWQCLTGRDSFLRAFFTDHHRRCEMLIALLPLLILVIHSLLYWRGKMASNGEVRYMLVVAPFWGLLSARGWEWAFQKLHWRRPLRWAALAALLPITLNAFYPVLPLRSQPDWVEAQQIDRWYQSEHRKAYPWIATAHPGILYYLDVSPTNGSRVREWRKDILEALPPGTILVWDPIYGIYNADAARSITVEELLKAGWKPLRTPWSNQKTAGKWKVFESAPIEVENDPHHLRDPAAFISSSRP